MTLCSTTLYQGAGEHLAEYASRLLASVERSYSTSERKGLVAVRPLTKLHACIEGSQITVQMVPQGLRLLMMGRPRRNVLQIQNFIECLPEKENVLIDPFLSFLSLHVRLQFKQNFDRVSPLSFYRNRKRSGGFSLFLSVTLPIYNERNCDSPLDHFLISYNIIINSDPNKSDHEAIILDI